MNTKRNQDDIANLYLRAVDLHQQGSPGKAALLYTAVAGHFPDAAEIHYNLGLALFETGKYGPAITAFRRAAAIHPEDTDILYNLGLACKKAGRYDAAEEAYLEALQREPDDPDILYNLGCCYQDAGAVDQACLVYEHLLQLMPDHVSGLSNLAYLYHLAKDFSRARELYGRVLELDPQRRSAQHMYASLSGRDAQAPPREYVRELFDQYSASFEENLTRDLEYNTCKILRRALDNQPEAEKEFAHALDLGCGTGLAGEEFHDVCHQLTGIDLSDRMLEQAARKDIYTMLISGDIVEFLEQRGPFFDLVIAADVLPYLGNLQPLFAAAAGRTTEKTIFLLSAEGSACPDWELQPSGRYAHNPDYVIRTATHNGWVALEQFPANIRREHDAWIRGSIFVLKRKDK